MSLAPTSSFDPFNQNFTILLSDGVTPVAVSMKDLDLFFYYNMASCIMFGAQLGASFLMFFVVTILTKESQRSTPVFVLNVLSLLLSFLRSLLLALYFVSPWSETYASLTLDFKGVPRSAYATSIAGSVIPLLMTVTVNLSLFMQANTVCKTMTPIHRHAVMGISYLVVLLVVGFRFVEAVTNSVAIMASHSFFGKSWIQVGSLATETISIWFFSLVFTSKLLWTLYIRKRNGWRQWSAVRILAAMGGCTMIIPSIFAVLEYLTPDGFPEAGTLAITVVALLLPLSSLWARMSTDSEESTVNLSHLSGSIMSQPVMDSQQQIFGSTSTAISSKPEIFLERKRSVVPISPTTNVSIVQHVPSGSLTRESTELDLEAVGVRVDKSYSVHSGRR